MGTVYKALPTFCLRFSMLMPSDLWMKGRFYFRYGNTLLEQFCYDGMKTGTLNIDVKILQAKLAVKSNWRRSEHLLVNGVTIRSCVISGILLSTYNKQTRASKSYYERWQINHNSSANFPTSPSKWSNLKNKL